MPDFSAWDKATALTVLQAACLWAGEDPVAFKMLLVGPQRAAVGPWLAMLTNAITTGELKANVSTNALATIGDHDSSVIQRSSLVSFAEARGLRPPFLFPSERGLDSSIAKSTTAPGISWPLPHAPTVATPPNIAPANGDKDRPAGNQPFDDDVLVTEIAATVLSGEFKSAHAATLARKDDIQGRGTQYSRVRRVADKVRDKMRELKRSR